MNQRVPWLPDAETVKARAWRAADGGTESSWRFPLPSVEAEAMLDLARSLASAPGPLVDTRLADRDRRAWSAAFAPVADTLETGPGFVIVDGLAGRNLSLEHQRASTGSSGRSWANR